MKKIFGALFLIILVAAGYVFWAVHRPLPSIQPLVKSQSLNLDSSSAQLDWPTSGESALGIVDSDISLTNGQQSQLPTASTAKVITALVVLKAKPLTNSAGPTITLTQNDVNIYKAYVAQDGSVVPVYVGEQITEYQMLEAMLIPSGNNIADSLAIWAYGSLPAYQTAATAYVKSIGLTDTTIGSDASGFSPTTTSTAHDLVKLGQIAMKNPYLAAIVNEKTASDIPGVSTVKNVNSLLGSNGIVGIKTGNNNQDLGVFLGASQIQINNKLVTVVTATMNQPSLAAALSNSLTLTQSAQSNFKPTNVLKAGSILGYYKSGNKNTAVVVADDAIIDTWSGSLVKANFSLPAIPANSKAGRVVSQVNITDPITGNQTSVDLKLATDPAKPTLWQRLTNF